jgi:hypothetical protein
MPEYYDERIDMDLLQSMSLHIKGCSQCRQEYALFKTTISYLGKFGPVKTPPQLNSTIKTCLKKEGLLPSPSIWATRRAVNKVAAVAAVFLLFIIVVTQAPWLEQDPVSPRLYPQPGSYVRPTNSDYLDPTIVTLSRDVQPVPYGNGYINPSADIVE